MRFEALSEEQLAKAGLLPDGEYNVEVVASQDSISQNHNDMIVLTLNVYDMEGNKRTVKDYLVASPGGLRKVRHACAQFGLLDRYSGGQLEAFDFVGKSGLAKIKIQPAKDGFPAKNSVDDYPPPRETKLPPKKFGLPANVKGVTTEIVDDEIPW